jgi:mannosyltransferase
MAPTETAMDANPKPPASISPAARRFDRISLVLLLVAGAALRFVNLTAKPFWFDECFSAVVARIGWPSFLRLLWWREANMSLYYLLLRIWVHFGSGEFFIRSLSVIVSAATIGAICWLASVLYERRVALIGAALFAFNAYSVRYAQEARSYALFALLATLSSAFLIAYLREQKRRLRTWYIAISILAVYAHFYALLLIASHWLALCWCGIPDASDEQAQATFTRQLRRAWIAIGIGVLPLLIFVAKTGAGPIRWIRRPGFHDLIRFAENLAGGNTWPLAAIYALACIAAVAPLGDGLWKRHQAWETWRAQFLLIWLLFPVLLTVALSFARPVFLPRYMIFCIPALVILTAAGLLRARPTWLLAPVLAGILFLSWQGIRFVYGHDFDAERDASGAAVDFILDHAQPGDAVVFHIAEVRVPYEFFRSARTNENSAEEPEILFPIHGPVLDYRDFTGKPTEDLLRSSASGHARLWVMLMYNETAAAPDPTTVMMDRVLPEVFPRARRWQLARVEVRLYSK